MSDLTTTIASIKERLMEKHGEQWFADIGVPIALSKKEKQEILERNGITITGDEMYTEDEWSRIMWATHAEINTVLRDIMEKKQT
jgi:hypothetical protein